MRQRGREKNRRDRGSTGLIDGRKERTEEPKSLMGMEEQGAHKTSKSPQKNTHPALHCAAWNRAVQAICLSPREHPTFGERDDPRRQPHSRTGKRELK